MQLGTGRQLRETRSRDGTNSCRISGQKMVFITEYKMSWSKKRLEGGVRQRAVEIHNSQCRGGLCLQRGELHLRESMRKNHQKGFISERKVASQRSWLHAVEAAWLIKADRARLSLEGGGGCSQ